MTVTLNFDAIKKSAKRKFLLEDYLMDYVYREVGNGTISVKFTDIDKLSELHPAVKPFVIPEKEDLDMWGNFK